MNVSFLLLAAVLQAPAAPAPSAPRGAAEILKILQGVDERQRNTADLKTQVYIEETDRGRPRIVREALIFRRDNEDRLLILITQPKTEQGNGYLRIDNNLWFYSLATGRWERRTDREAIGGSTSRRADFDESRLALEYDATYDGEGKVGAFNVMKLLLKVKPNVEVAYPQVRVWIDLASGNLLKREDFTQAGKLVRTAYYPKWKKQFSPSKNADIWIPEESRFFDEIVKGSSTVVRLKNLDLNPLPENIFTKAWLESKSR